MGEKKIFQSSDVVRSYETDDLCVNLKDNQEKNGEILKMAKF